MDRIKNIIFLIVITIYLTNCSQDNFISQKSLNFHETIIKETTNVIDIKDQNKYLNLNINLVTEKNDSNISKLNIKSMKNNNIGLFNDEIYYVKVEINGKNFKKPIIKPLPFVIKDLNSSLIKINTNNIPESNNIIITVYLLDKEYFYLGKQFTIMGIVNIDKENNIYADINWNTTPTAKVIQLLINSNSKYLDLVNIDKLQKIINTIINFNTFDKNDDIHPSLVNIGKIYDFIILNKGKLPNINNINISDYRLIGESISGRIEGISYNFNNKGKKTKYIPVTKVICNDPASKVITVTDLNGNFTINGITPGKNYILKIIPEFHSISTVLNISSNSKNVQLKVKKEHYLENSIHEKYGIMRFENPNSIKVQFIIPSNNKAESINYKEYHKKAVLKSLELWEYFSNNAIKFKILPDIKDTDVKLREKKLNSDIYIEWTKVINLGNAIGVTQTFPDIESISIPPLPSNQVNFLSKYKASISFATYDSYNNQIPEISLHYLASHEIGHALGLALVDPGSGNIHPKNSLDSIMFSSVDFIAPTNLNLSFQDLNTLKFLYSIPNI